MWQTVKSATQDNELGPLPPQPNTNLMGPQPDPSVLEPVALQVPADPQPDQSKLKSITLQDPDDPQPGPSVLETAVLQDPDDPQLDPSVLKPTALQNPVVPRTLPPWPVQSAFRRRRRIGDPVPYIPPATLPFCEFYEWGRLIGKGGNGSVYEGIRKSDGQKVAIKFIPKRTSDNNIKILGCFEPVFEEVAINLLMKQPPLSPYIVYMLEWFEEEDDYILILEYPRPCKSLRRFLNDNRPRLYESLARGLMIQAVLGAKHCLDREVFHCSIKEDNMLVNTLTMELKLIDFGGSCLVNPSGFENGHLGGCRPPEYPSEYHAGPTTVWSLGAVLYSMVTGNRPFKTAFDRMIANVTIDHTLSRECQDLINRCLARDPAERATLDEILQHEWFQQGQISGVAQESGSVT
ncbi:serine/threonine-protein kinase pim-2-like isoform X2 [Onychostoma macrolepis]|nr:serine/threonine-protein kinase pim-2-like isoform X2 [Onychostoma macrolepis]